MEDIRVRVDGTDVVVHIEEKGGGGGETVIITSINPKLYIEQGNLYVLVGKDYVTDGYKFVFARYNKCVNRNQKYGDRVVKKGWIEPRQFAKYDTQKTNVLLLEYAKVESTEPNSKYDTFEVSFLFDGDKIDFSDVEQVGKITKFIKLENKKCGLYIANENGERVSEYVPFTFKKDKEDKLHVSRWM